MGNGYQDSLDSRIRIDIPSNASAEQIALLSRVRALDERLQKRPSPADKEIRVLLVGAADSALLGGDTSKGAELLSEAHAAYEQAIQTTNRMQYLLGLFVGLFLAVIIGAAVVLAAQLPAFDGTSKRFGNLASPDTILSLFTFAGMGSVTSVLSRLTSLDLRAEISPKFVICSAMARPFVAISFASVVYVILANGIITFGNWSCDAQNALYLVAAFLCGFSERFASDILGRVVPAGQT